MVLPSTSAWTAKCAIFDRMRVGALLAYLSLHLGRHCSREELYEALWPEEDHATVANRFRVTLSSLRRQMEPPGIQYGTVIDTSVPGLVTLRSETVWCDVCALNTALARGETEAVANLALGVLLPGYYDECDP